MLHQIKTHFYTDLGLQKFKDFSRPLSIFLYFQGKFNFQGLFQDIPVYSSTFQACGNHVMDWETITILP